MTTLDDLKRALERQASTAALTSSHRDSRMIRRWVDEDIESVYRVAILWRDGASPGTAEYLEGMALINSFIKQRASLQ